MKPQRRRSATPAQLRALAEGRARPKRARQAAVKPAEMAAGRAKLHDAIDALAVPQRDKPEAQKLLLTNAEARYAATAYTELKNLQLLVGLNEMIVAFGAADAHERAGLLSGDATADGAWYATASAGVTRLIGEALALLGAELMAIHEDIDGGLTPVAGQEEGAK